MRTLAGMGLLSAAALLLQVALTRVFSIAQFYHFAFLVVSLALLGFGASGSLLVLFPRWRSPEYGPRFALGFSAGTGLAYLFVNNFPFDSYSIAWDRDQIGLLILNLLGLAIPFVLAGGLIGAMLTQESGRAGAIYSANLLGSALGAISAPLVISLGGSERTVLLCVILGALAALLLHDSQRLVAGVAVTLIFISSVMLVYLPDALQIKPSQYKNLNRFRLDPDSHITATYQNAYSQLDIVESASIHSAQGLSLTYFGAIPPQIGLLIDGDNLLPVPDTGHANPGLAAALPVSVAYHLRPGAESLILGSGGGMDVWAAFANGASSVHVVEPNSLVFDALTGELSGWFGLNTDVITFEHEQIRTFTQRSDRKFDVVILSLTDNYRPISSGAFTLTENYSLTVEAFESYLSLLDENGVLVLNRWLQSPPSESLRTLAIIIEALGDRDPVEHLVVFRSFQTATFLVKASHFTDEEVTTLLDRIGELRYDLVLAPEMPTDMINRYARIETPIYHELFLELATSSTRAEIYDRYTFEITPPTDDRPFFFHFFRWEQTPDILENLGKRWQPFGGSGYLMLLALLIFAALTAFTFILFPVVLRRNFRAALRERGIGAWGRILGYFVAIGLAFLLVEVALIQRYILLLGQPTLAIAVIIGELLLFSGIGSSFAHRLPWRVVMIALVFLLALHTTFAGPLAPFLLPLPKVARIAVITFLIAPLGFLMGVPFARGVLALQNAPEFVPWAWAANGSASVISAVLAVMLALSWGFTGVLWIGAGFYLAAAVLSEFEVRPSLP